MLGSLLSILVIFVLPQPTNQLDSSYKVELNVAGYQQNTIEINRIGGILMDHAGNDSAKVADVYALIYNAYYTAHAIDSALHYLKISARLNEKLGRLKLAASTYRNMSIYFDENLQFDESVMAAHQALALYQKLGDEHYIVSSFISISKLNRNFRNQKEAEFYARKAISLSKRQGFERESANAHIALVNTLNEQNKKLALMLIYVGSELPEYKLAEDKIILILQRLSKYESPAQ